MLENPGRPQRPPPRGGAPVWAGGVARPTRGAGGMRGLRMSDEVYAARPDRYDRAHYRRCGRSGLLLPAVSLGLWQNFGGLDSFETGRAVLRRAFDRGVTHFDLANNYGPPPGAAEEGFGRVLHSDFSAHRDELIISTKAGWDMWPGR